LFQVPFVFKNVYLDVPFKVCCSVECYEMPIWKQVRADSSISTVLDKERMKPERQCNKVSNMQHLVVFAKKKKDFRRYLKSYT